MGKEAENNTSTSGAGPAAAKTNGAAGSAGSAKKSDPPATGPGLRFVRYLLVIALTGAVLLAWLSVLTYNPADPPSANVYPPQQIRNAAGAAGALLAYTLRYWLGDGAYVLLTYATVLAFIWLAGGRVSHWPWRLVGLAVLVAVMSAASYLLGPRGPEAVMAGNILGAAAGEFLLTAFSPVGSWVVLVVAFGIGLMFTADRIVMKLPRAGRKLWDNRRGVSLPSWPSLRRKDARCDLQHMPPAPRAVAAAGARATLTGRPKDKNPPEPAPAPKPAAVAVPPRPARDKPQGKDEPAKASPGQYDYPSTALLAEPEGQYQQSQAAAVLAKRSVLQQTLDDFGVEAQVVGHMTGPVISMFELSLAPGVKVNRIDSLARDIARALAVPGVRVVSPLEGRDTVGIEVPNLDKETVRLKELMELAPGAADQMQLPLYLGKDAEGLPIVADLATMPHMLLAGTTGSGKSVCINAIISAILMTRAPEFVRLILIDPKMVEMASYEKIPHLLCPIVNDMRRAEDILEWAAARMDERYELLKATRVRNIVGYNRLGPEELYKRFGAETDEEKAQVLTRMAYYVIVVDELADLIMTSSKEVENHIIRIAQKARAVGIHLIVATQRPSVNVVTGLIKSNMPCRISFRVASRQESRIVLDQNGADVLLGQGDMLFLKPGTSHLARAQGTYVSEEEIRSVVEHVSKGREPEFNSELVRIQSGFSDGGTGERDELFDKAVEVVLQSQRGSVSLLQRRLAIGYSRASRIVDQMAEAGILGDYKGSQAREVMLTLEDWHALKASVEADQSGANALDGTPTSV